MGPGRPRRRPSARKLAAGFHLAGDVWFPFGLRLAPSAALPCASPSCPCRLVRGAASSESRVDRRWSHGADGCGPAPRTDLGVRSLGGLAAHGSRRTPEGPGILLADGLAIGGSGRRDFLARTRILRIGRPDRSRPPPVDVAESPSVAASGALPAGLWDGAGSRRGWIAGGPDRRRPPDGEPGRVGGAAALPGVHPRLGAASPGGRRLARPDNTGCRRTRIDPPRVRAG